MGLNPIIEFARGVFIDTLRELYYFPIRLFYRPLGFLDSFHDTDPTWEKFYQNNIARSKQFTDHKRSQVPIALLDTFGQTTLRTLEVGFAIINGIAYQTGIPSVFYALTNGYLGQGAPTTAREAGQLFGGDLLLIGGARLAPYLSSENLARYFNIAGDTLTSLAQYLTGQTRPQQLSLAKAKGSNELGAIGVSAEDAILSLKERGREALRNRQPEEALSLLKNAVRLEKRRFGQPNPQTLCDLGKALKRLGKFKKAISALRFSIRIEPSARAFVKLGKILNRSGKREEALVAFERATEIDPNDAKALLFLGVAYREFGRLNDSQMALERAVQLKGDLNGPEARQLEYTLNALEGKQPGGTTPGSFSLLELIREAGHQMDIRNYARAADLYEKIVVLETGKFGHAAPQSLTNLGIAYRAIGQLKKSVEVLRASMEREPHPRVLRELGISLRYQGKYATALEALREANRMERGQNAETLYQMGSTLARLNRLPEAENCLREAIKWDKKRSAKIRHELAFVLHKEGKLPEALDAIDEAISHYSFQPNYWLERGTILRRLKRSDEAETSLKKALEMEEESPPVLHELGLALLEKGEAVGAKIFIEKCIANAKKSSPTWRKAMITLAKVYKKMGDIERALKTLTHLIRELEDNKIYYPPAYLELITFLLNAGRSDKAKTVLHRALEIDYIGKGPHQTLWQELQKQWDDPAKVEEAIGELRSAYEMD